MPRIVVDSDSEEENANDTNHIDSEESGSDQSDQDSGAGPQEAPAKAKKAEAQGSWVHLYAEKVKKDGKVWFYCKVENKNGKRCSYKGESKKANTTNIGNHLKNKHFIKPPPKEIQTTMDFFSAPSNSKVEKQKAKTFREAFAELVTKQYLPFSLIQEQSLQNSYLIFHKEWVANDQRPKFVTDKTVASDIKTMADQYVVEIKKRFTSKLSLCMDAWTGPNKMSFLGITFTYLDDDFRIQRGLLEMLKMKKKHTGVYIAKLFQKAMDLYGIEKNMVGGVTQDNASNCGSCTDTLVAQGYDRGIFFGCFLHVLNLACQAAIEVYDPRRKSKVTRIRLVNDDDFSNFSGSEDSHDEEDLDYLEDDGDMVEEEVVEDTCSLAVKRAREIVVFINRNDTRREAFAKCQRICNLPTKLLVKDMKVRWNSTHDMISSLIENEKAFNILPNIDSAVEWPLLVAKDWEDLKELHSFLERFKNLTLNFSKTTECRMSDVCLDFEELLVAIKKDYLDKKSEFSDNMWYAANAAYTKLTKYYQKIDSPSYAIAVVLDPRYKLEAYVATQDPVALRASAEYWITEAFGDYYYLINGKPLPSPIRKESQQKRGRYEEEETNELIEYLKERRPKKDTNPLDWWRSSKERFPVLARMARDYLALQPTSRDVEGNFSKARRTIPYYRRSQSSAAIRNQMLVNSGYNLGVF